MNIGSRGNKYLSRGGVCALAMALAACGQSQNPAPAGGAATTGSAPAAATAAAPASTAPAGMQPTAVSFPNKYGSLTFPEQFPAGTTLTITQWHHFVPRYDKWFDKYAQEWGQHNNVKVVVQHINLGDLVPTLSAAIAARKGSDLFEMVSPPASFIQGLQSLDDVNQAAEQAFGKALDVCTSQTYLPIKKQWYGYCHG